MKIETSKIEDIPEIFRLYKQASAFQKIKFPANQWPQFDSALIETEVVENRQFKLLIDEDIACIWAITYSDPEIWAEADNTDSIYIHRIATNPDYRGNNFVKTIVAWAKDFATSENKKFIRLDTCGENKRLIAHYTSCGFEFLGMKKLKSPSGLPAHYQQADVCFFEIALK